MSQTSQISKIIIDVLGEVVPFSIALTLPNRVKSYLNEAEKSFITGTITNEEEDYKRATQNLSLAIGAIAMERRVNEAKGDKTVTGLIAENAESIGAVMMCMAKHDCLKEQPAFIKKMRFLSRRLSPYLP